MIIAAEAPADNTEASTGDSAAEAPAETGSYQLDTLTVVVNGTVTAICNTSVTISGSKTVKSSLAVFQILIDGRKEHSALEFCIFIYLPEFWQDAYPAITQDANGTWIDGFQTDATKAALLRLQQAYKDGAIHIRYHMRKRNRKAFLRCPLSFH